jgi:hypothetical protein
LDDLTRSWFRMQFRDMVRQKTGTAYQDFFVDIMKLSHPDGLFVPVISWGREGDQKCDGYFVPSKTVFQVYAPSELGESKTIAKISTDFKGAVDHWKADLRGWTFVHNAPRGGVPAGVVQMISDLARANLEVAIKIWNPDDLWDQMCQKLPQSKFETLLGFPPTREGMDNLDLGVVQEVLDGIARTTVTPAPDLRPVPKDKMQINQLSPDVELLLTAGMTHVKQVELFLESEQHPQYGDQLATTFSRRYAESCRQGLEPDAVFMELVRFAGGPDVISASRTCAVLAVLAYLFERCDIFRRTATEENRQ